MLFSGYEFDIEGMHLRLRRLEERKCRLFDRSVHINEHFRYLTALASYAVGWEERLRGGLSWFNIQGSNCPMKRSRRYCRLFQLEDL